jgi:antitoxin VapB
VFRRNDGFFDISAKLSDAPRIMPMVRRLDKALEKFGAFSDDFMADGRGDNLETERDAPRISISCCAAASSS